MGLRKGEKQGIWKEFVGMTDPGWDVHLCRILPASLKLGFKYTVERVNWDRSEDVKLLVHGLSQLVSPGTIFSNHKKFTGPCIHGTAEGPIGPYVALQVVTAWQGNASRPEAEERRLTREITGMYRRISVFTLFSNKSMHVVKFLNRRYKVKESFDSLFALRKSNGVPSRWIPTSSIYGL